MTLPEEPAAKAASTPGTPEAAPKVIALVGSTASGKSAVALNLARHLNGELVSVDSMQVYRGMDIGTAKPTAVERARVPHHLIDLVEVHQPFNAAAYRAAALPALTGIMARGKLPILCGGTGFYFAALGGALGNAPASSPELRAELEPLPTARLLEELRQRDPQTYATVDRHNRRRVLRALEVVRLAGQPFSALRAADPTPASSAPFLDLESWRVFGLLRQPEDLRRRIAARTDAMIQQGLIEETQRLLGAGLAQNPTAMQAIGYRQVVEFLQGHRSLTETRELIVQRTRQLAKRQLTWFRHQMHVHWLNVSPDESPSETAQRIAGLLGPE